MAVRKYLIILLVGIILTAGGLVWFFKLSESKNQPNNGTSSTEITVVGEVEVTVADDFENQQATFTYILITGNDDRYELVFSEDPTLLSGSELEVTGKLEEPDKIIVSSYKVIKEAKVSP